MSILLEVRNATKVRQGKRVVDSVSLFVEPGESVALVGPAKCGKTSLMQMIYGASEITAGDIFVFGLNIKTNAQRIKTELGVVPQDNYLDLDFNIMDNLLLFARYHGVNPKVARPKIREILRTLKLDEQDNRPITEMSEALRRKIVFARALVNQPRLLLADEPTRDLERADRELVWQRIDRLRKSGGTVIFSTSSWREAEALASRVLLMKDGKVVAAGAAKELIKTYVGPDVVEFKVKPNDMDYYVRKIGKQFNYQVMNEKIRVYLDDQEQFRSALDLVSSEQIYFRKSCLDDVYLKLTGQHLNERIENEKPMDSFL